MESNHHRFCTMSLDIRISPGGAGSLSLRRLMRTMGLLIKKIYV